MGIPIVIATNGYGIPVTEAANGYGTPVEIAANGYGTPVVIVASGGLPVVGSGGGGPDVTAPLAVSFSPTDNATGVSVSTLLIVQFDSVVTLGTGNVTLKKTSDNSTIEAWNVVTEAGTGAGQVSVEGLSQLTMRLTTSIAGGVEYYVIWDANVVKDLSNNPVAANASTTLWSFTTLSSSSYDPASDAIFASFTTPPTTQRKTDINNCVLALKAAGIWAKLDVLYGFAAADSQAAAINWKNPGTYNATTVNTPAFAADRGFTGGGTAYLDSGFNPITAPTPNIVQNSAAIFGWSLTNASVVGGIIGQAATGSGEGMIYPLSSGNTLVYIHQGTSSSFANADGSGLFTTTRRAAGSAETYRNTTSLGTSSQTSAAPINQNYNILRRATAYWTGQAAAAGLGSQLSAVEVTALYDALNTYLTAVGALGPTYQAETDAIAAAFTTPPTTARKNLIDAAVVSLKSAGVWAKLDALYAFAAADSQAAKINWIAPGTYNCTEVNAPAFAADRGFTGASTKYLATGFAASTAPSPKFTQDSATVFGWSLTDVDVVGGIIGQTAGIGVGLFPRNGNQVIWSVNQSGSSVVANTNGLGLYAATRLSAASTKQYKNGTEIGSGSVASAAVTANPTAFLRRATDYWTGECAAGGFGSQLSAAEQLALHDALRAYLTGVGVP